MRLDPEQMAKGRIQLERVFNKYRTLMELPLDFGTGEKLYPSEAHFLAAVGEGAGGTVTGLAEALGVTKGAVSQMASKLEARRYVRRTQPGGDSGKEVSIELTERGNTAFQAHADLHRRMEASLAGAMSGARPGDLAAFGRLFGLLETHLEGWLDELGAK